MLIVGYPLSLQLGFDLLTHLLGFSDFPDAGDHREHDPQVAVRGCAVQCPKLCVEDLRPVKTDPQSPVSECRVLFFRQFERAYLLVSADIERADYDFPALHIRERFFICLELIILCGIIISVQIQEFAAEQPDAVGVV